MSVDVPHPGLVLEPHDSPTHPLAASFEDIRKLRRAHYASRPKPRAPRSRAIITMVYNERVFFPIWLRYYSRWFAPEDIYVLDNESSDGSTLRGGFVRIPVEHDTVDHTWMEGTIEGFQHELVDRYDVVVVTDVDEIIAVAPRRGTLGGYLDSFDEEWVNCLGYELLHMRDREPPLRPDRPILEQRRYWFVNGAYDKAALTTVPMRWKPGFHGRTDSRMNPEPDLRLIHLHRMDYLLCLERHRTRLHKRWAQFDAEQGWATHNQVVEEDDFAHWFYERSGFEAWGYEIKPEEIPAAWRGLI